ncbi:hypothetical protein [Cylindrospermum sp. FACHB-282]|uniref:hypothetical protein n=1 Tax=Cylindrospermum sp. FACHB-282 TaxID=2692794 RepID=UPI00168655C1|nr:hypothetical protein [Cylindrospermum sp. FACHB-282]MBD2386029.1 hypothetical protein [Cylindrospermum sp. FACHB-282]
MAIQFKNTRYLPDGSQGEITVIAEWSVWNCQQKRWIDSTPTVLRNILLAALHPNTEFCIGEIDKNETNSTRLNPFKPKDYENAFFLDLASGSRNHGRFTFANKSTIGKRYYGGAEKDQWKRIIYGSIVHTGCKKLIYKQLKFVVVDDEARDADGNFLDDQVNGIHWETGDSHAKASRDLMTLLGLPADDEDKTVDPERPIQFRAALFKEWVGKGTVAYNPKLDGSGYDLAIPLSSLKGNKPALGNHEGKLLMGLVFEAEERRAKPGWMLFQWFDFQTLEKDGIISKLEEKCDRLSQAYNSIVDLADILRIDQSEAEAELEEGSDSLQSEAEYENTMIRVIQVDKNGLLLLHPYIVRRVKERMQAVWLNLAKAAGVRFYSLMGQPDESLAHYHVVLPDGRIKGKRVFCAPDFEPGEYMVFRNPMRHWGDIQLWENRHEGTYLNSTGIMAAPKLLLLTVGGDTDGDFYNLIKSSAYPNMRSAITNFAEPPTTKKFPKMALQGSLQEIAIKSMNDLTGIVASLLARARAANAEDAVILIPAGGEQKEDEEMRVIDFLSQQVQIAVDSLKSAYPNNSNGLDAVKKFLDEVEGEAPWLKDFKDEQCYRDRTCKVTPGATDTVSRLVQTVNGFWKAPDLTIDSKPSNYEKVLFGDVEFEEIQLERAIAHRAAYRAAMKSAIEWKAANDDSTRMIREVAEATKNSKEKTFAITKPDGSLYSRESWVSAYWTATHRAETGDAGLVFMIFADEIIQQLKNTELKEAEMILVYGVNKGKWAANWKGQQVQIRAIIQEFGDKQYLSLEMKWDGAKTQLGWHLLGNISDKFKPYVLPGFTKTMKIYTISFDGQNKAKRVVLFNADMPQEEINKTLLFDYSIKL